MIDFVVWGTPRSHSAKSRPHWQGQVKAAVPPKVELLSGPLRLRIDFFFRGQTDLDTDNIIKPIQDALEKVIYDNDKTIVDVCSRKIDLHRLPPTTNAPASLLSALAMPPREFVLIRVAGAHRSLSFT
ncbi:RusA family crossover junction endodeoxyribonuclease [Candidatus Spongiisocius sp.]|uniref:RusA family crossover junction endodeoxyribonuclease n=1 Tax=Candidatus Spongiisocius sp. TaxID=3101273 RepID=UPI003B58E15F